MNQEIISVSVENSNEYNYSLDVSNNNSLSYLANNNEFDVSQTNNLTITAWIKPESISSSGYIVQHCGDKWYQVKANIAFRLMKRVKYTLQVRALKIPLEYCPRFRN